MRYAKLGEVCSKGVSSLRQKDTLSIGDYPVYGASGICGYLSDYQHNEPYVAVVKDGAGVGRVQLCSGKSSVLGTLQALLPKDEVSCEYLFEVVRSLKLGDGFTGSTIPHIYFKDYKNRTVAIYEKEQQIKITTLFAVVKNLIELQKRMIYSCDELVKSRFMEMFGDPESNSKNWQIKLLGEVCNTRLGKMLDKKKQSGTKLYPYLANANVQWFYFDLDNLNMMDFDESDRAEFKLQEGDVLATEGGDVGRCAVWHCEVEECFFQKAIHRIRCHRDVLIPDYFVWAFKMKADLGLFEPYTSQSTIAHLTGKKIKQVPIQIPPLALQHEFADFVRQVDKLKFETQQSIEKLQTLYDSLAQEYFAPEGD